MRKSCLLAAILLLSVWAFAQTAPPAEQQSNPVQAAASQGNGADRAGNTIEGCLAGAGGSFTLTDSSGKTYQLDGDTAKLAEHVGHTLRISGSAKSGGDPQGGASAQPTFTVKNVKMVSSSCSPSK